MSKILENRLGDLIHDLNEIKKQILLEKFVKVDIAQKKVNKWKMLIKKVSAKWDGPSAVEEILHQREKTW